MIVPAHNEERSIRVAVRNLLALDYPQLEIIVINDGSEDRTLDEMQEEFRLRRVRAVYISEAECAPVRGLYRSEVDARLLIIRQRIWRQQSGRRERRFECRDFTLYMRCGC
jgi:glycosyltransferase involved in cell wall biosynthesis